MFSGADPRRVQPLNDAARRPGPVVYWMSRGQRAHDNWALIHAQAMAMDARAPLAVVFCLVPEFLGAMRRQYAFMLAGLAEVESGLARLGIPFFLLTGEPVVEIAKFVKSHKAGAVVTEFDPLRIKLGWRSALASICGVQVVEVDARNVMPARYVSGKQVYGAYTIRPKITRLLHDFLTRFPKMNPHPHPWPRLRNSRQYATGFDAAMNTVRAAGDAGVSKAFVPGEAAAGRRLRKFVRDGLSAYDAARNDPNRDGQSGLSPYLHFGQLSAQRVAYAVTKADEHASAKAAFIEELVIRRELSDSFCLYNAAYDSIDGIPNWARATLDAHRADPREYVYTQDAFEAGSTHDPLWNAAQMEMAVTGKMHGYMRMYWAKKILEWSETPENAFATAIALNDRFSIDGRDPNGYAGIAWSIGGVHDRAWGERPVFGKIRYMSYNGCRGKFDVKAYIRRVEEMR